MNNLWNQLERKPDTTPPKRGRGRPKLESHKPRKPRPPAHVPAYLQEDFGTLAERLKKLGLE